MAKKPEEEPIQQPPDGVDLERLRDLLRRREDKEEFEFGTSKELSFSETAENMEIPEEHWDYPEVQAYVNLHNALERARGEVTLLTLGNAISGEERPESPVDLGPDLQQRYWAIQSLINSALLILHDDGKDKRPFDPDRTGDVIFEPKTQEQLEDYEASFFDPFHLQENDEGVELYDPQPLPNRLQDHLDCAVSSYGLRVVPTDLKHKSPLI